MDLTAVAQLLQQCTITLPASAAIIDISRCISLADFSSVRSQPLDKRIDSSKFGRCIFPRANPIPPKVPIVSVITQQL